MLSLRAETSGQGVAERGRGRALVRREAILSVVIGEGCSPLTPALPARGREFPLRRVLAFILATERMPSPSPLRGGARGGGRDPLDRVRASAGKPQFETSGKLTRANAKRMRREPTGAERRLWRGLREHVVVSASHFRRQVPLGPYIADFCCLGSRLIVEVDGEQHGSEPGLRRDAKRDAYLAAEGFRILRFSNRDVMTSMSSVLDTIHASLSPLNDKDASTPTPDPSPHGGGGQARGPEF